MSVETSGVLGPQTLSFVKELGKRLKNQTGEVKSACYLMQRLSMAVQRGNGISVLGGLGSLPAF